VCDVAGRGGPSTVVLSDDLAMTVDSAVRIRSGAKQGFAHRGPGGIGRFDGREAVRGDEIEGSTHLKGVPTRSALYLALPSGTRWSICIAVGER